MTYLKYIQSQPNLSINNEFYLTVSIRTGPKKPITTPEETLGAGVQILQMILPFCKYVSKI